MASQESPEMIALFTTYTASPDSIGSHLTQATASQTEDDPLIVATGADLALYPGGGQDPQVEGFRMSTRGFKELAGISHLPPALASLVNIRALRGDGSWREDGERLLGQVETARAANSVELWRDTIAVQAYQGREEAIADLIDYSCAVTARYLRTALADESYLNATTLREDYLVGAGVGTATDEPGVPMNQMMIATFFLVGMDIAHRVLRWFGAHRIDWTRAMVVIAGRQGRVTAGVTWNTSSVAAMILGASGRRLPVERVYMAPHAPVFATPQHGDLSEVKALEPTFRAIWNNIRATQELGPLMFDGYPRYVPGGADAPDLQHGHTEISDMPKIHSADDMLAMVTRLRVVLEDPRQLLSGCVADYAVEQLVANDNDPSRVIVPGLDRVAYPRGL
ncbi:MAG TPA: DUF5624 domain-containing protein [Pseudonocardia sp.]|uniref:DUF5624 domain-containing protein n=1 Tax=Pseudonocardia sp. TaxID=60912 RepID=UPI002ED89A51